MRETRGGGACGERDMRYGSVREEEDEMVANKDRKGGVEVRGRWIGSKEEWRRVKWVQGERRE